MTRVSEGDARDVETPPRANMILEDRETTEDRGPPPRSGTSAV